MTCSGLSTPKRSRVLTPILRPHVRSSTQLPGHHARTGQYAKAALDHAALESDIDAFDDLRSIRNQAEYDALEIESFEVEELLAHAHQLIAEIRADLAREAS